MHTLHTASTTGAAGATTPRPRPGLALLLGILAVPGSTVAWDLPSGGLWIGLPLAVAAIVLGLRARRAGAGTRQATTGVVLASLAVLQMAIWMLVSLVS